jgi:hypothetical protein
VAKFGIVVLSPSFFAKNWPKYELSGLKARQLNGEQIILPVWHNVELGDVIQFSPPLADMLAFNSSKQTAEEIAEGIVQIVNPQNHSRWLIQTIRKVLQDLDKAENQGTSFDYWPNGGLRILYHYLRTFATYAQLSLHFGTSVWVSGPHTAKELDLHHPTSFGHYNPRFVEWLRSNIRFVTTKRAFVLATSAIYGQYLSEIVTRYYVTYQLLRGNPDVMQELTKSFQEGLATGTLPQQYYYNLAWSVAPEEQSPVHKLIEVLDKQLGHDSNVTCTAVYFWVRRHLDGTAPLFFSILVDLFVAYEEANYVNVNMRGRWDLNSFRSEA